MDRLPIFLFWLLVTLFVNYVTASIPTLPEQMATHFGSGGVPNGEDPLPQKAVVR